MKLKITYETKEIEALILEDLARQGIPATNADIIFSKNCAVVSVEATRDGTLDPTVAAPVAPTVAPPAPLTVVDGGNTLVDMGDVLGASKKIAQQKPGNYPPGERTLMEGESTDFPGTPGARR